VVGGGRAVGNNNNDNELNNRNNNKLNNNDTYCMLVKILQVLKSREKRAGVPLHTAIFIVGKEQISNPCIYSSLN
jgi:hypothetical protein